MIRMHRFLFRIARGLSVVAVMMFATAFAKGTPDARAASSNQCEACFESYGLYWATHEFAGWTCEMSARFCADCSSGDGCHRTVQPGWCWESHGTCGAWEPLTEAELEALAESSARGDTHETTRRVQSLGLERFAVNWRRASVQVVGCNGAVTADFPVNLSELVEDGQ